MIPVAKVKKPRNFEAKVKRPGNIWLSKNPKAKRPKAFWIPFTEYLGAGFLGRCGYAAMLDPTGGTVDHYLSFKNHRQQAYEWNNYRFASGPLNSSKRNLDDSVLDPYEIEAGWFEVILPSLQMRVTKAVPANLKQKAEFTLKRLKLQDGERIIQWRISWYRMYQSGELSLEGLRTVAPLVAEAVEREVRAQQ